MAAASVRLVGLCWWGGLEEHTGADKHARDHGVGDGGDNHGVGFDDNHPVGGGDDDEEHDEDDEDGDNSLVDNDHNMEIIPLSVTCEFMNTRVSLKIGKDQRAHVTEHQTRKMGRITKLSKKKV